jgi:hypothetical protein
MAASVAAQKMTSAVSRDSAFPEGQGQEAEDASRELTEELYPGSTCAVKIRTVAARARRYGIVMTSRQPACRFCRLPGKREPELCHTGRRHWSIPVASGRE